MRYLTSWWGKAFISRVDTHVYFNGKIFYKWQDDDVVYEANFSPSCEIAIESFEQLVMRRIIVQIEKITPETGDFFQLQTYEELSQFVKERSRIVFTNDPDQQPREDLFFQLNINLIRTKDILFDMLFLGYKYPFENISMPIEVFHEFIDRLKPKMRINSIHGAKRMKIFIAHASENKAFAERLANDLISRGFLVWFDKWEIKVGDSIVAKINEGIDSASFMIVVLSKNSVNKQWVKEEINAGFIKGLNAKSVYLIPVLLEKCDVPALLADKKYANFSSSYDDGLAELLSSL